MNHLNFWFVFLCFVLFFLFACERTIFFFFFKIKNTVMIKRTHLNSINVAPYDNDDSSPETTRLIDDSPVGSDTSLKKLEDVGTNSVRWTYVLIFKGYVGAGILGNDFI